MAANSVSASLAALDARLNRMIEQYPERNRQLHTRMGEAMLPVVRVQVPEETGPRPYRVPGTVRSWQRLTVGSKGGYFAIRPYQKGVGGSKQRDNITIYLNDGHAIRKPRHQEDAEYERKYRYKRGRVHMSGVPGRHFYERAQQDVAGICVPIAQAFVDELGAELGASL